MLNKKQLNKCQAWIYYDGKDIRHSKYVALVSYNTLICVYDHDDYSLHVGENFNCSATTRKHLSTFCRDTLGFITYCDIRDYLTKAIDAYTGEIKNVGLYERFNSKPLVIENCFSNSLYWRGVFSAWRLENAINEKRF